ncbi:Uncharacterised protein [Mycobacteroides abscessus subsp. abscessus]|nr:Uncharacterised protein [Mycobacteroides abscessus subsp. abscessus]
MSRGRALRLIMLHTFVLGISDTPAILSTVSAGTGHACLLRQSNYVVVEAVQAAAGPAARMRS